MKKNKSMRTAVSLLILTLITTCMIGGTFAKYITTAADEVAARVAGWGFENVGEIDIEDLFSTSYQNVLSRNEEKIIAPGTEGSVNFSFAYEEVDGVTAPEVAYTFKIDTTGSLCDEEIQANENIHFYLDDDEDLLTWNGLIAAIKALSGDASGEKAYAAGQLPTDFTADDDVHTIGWVWDFYTDDDSDVVDTALGNMAELSDIELHISITATQLD